MMYETLQKHFSGKRWYVWRESECKNGKVTRYQGARRSDNLLR